MQGAGSEDGPLLLKGVVDWRLHVLQSRIDLRMFNGRPPGDVLWCLHWTAKLSAKKQTTHWLGVPAPCTTAAGRRQVGSGV